MRSRHRILIALGAVAAMAAIGHAAFAMRSERIRLDAAEQRLRETRAMVERVLALRQSDERIGAEQRPKQDVIALVNAVLAEAGIAAEHFKNLEQESDVPLATRAAGNLGLRRQSLALALENLAPQEIGAFFAKWHAAQRLWIPSRLELSHARTPPSALNLYSMRLVITATYVAPLKAEARDRKPS